MKKLFLVLLLISFAQLVFAQSATDPIRLATGSRPLGMGKAYVGLADDLNSVFLNPAGLANPERWQMTSMSGKLLEEYNYLSLSGIYPTEYGTLGLAFTSVSIGGALPTTIEAGSDPNDPVYAIDSTQPPISYYNNLAILSYGTKLDKLANLSLLAPVFSRAPWLKNINFGANLKFFLVNLTGDGITQGNAAGNELDLGLQGKALSWISLGANIQNALPSAMGGKLHYESGWDESYPAILKLGAAADVLGPKDALRTLGANRLTLLADVDYEISRANNVPLLWHLGMEWRPIDLIALRAGIDQDLVGPGEVANNLASGVGLYYGDFRFDYAYHQFFGAPGIQNHFFSLSYGIAPVKRMDKRLSAQPDRLITKQAAVTVEGTAFDNQIISVRVNAEKIGLNPKGAFWGTANLKIGRNNLMVEGIDSKEKLIAAEKLRIVRLIQYPDVKDDYWAEKQISYIGTLDIIKGYPDSTFRPEGNISRAELSTLLIRTLMGGDDKVPPAEAQTFKDVSLKHWAVKYINLAARNGIVKGYPNGGFKPAGNVTRAEGLAMIARFGGIKETTPEATFSDINNKHWAAKIISGAYQGGILEYLKGQPKFEPNKPLTRAEAVEMLYRTAPVSKLVKDLLDFDRE